MPAARSFSRCAWRDDRSLPAPAYADGVRDIAPRLRDCHVAGGRWSSGIASAGGRSGRGPQPCATNGLRTVPRNRLFLPPAWELSALRERIATLCEGMSRDGSAEPSAGRRR